MSNELSAIEIDMGKRFFDKFFDSMRFVCRKNLVIRIVGLENPPHAWDELQETIQQPRVNPARPEGASPRRGHERSA